MNSPDGKAILLLVLVLGAAFYVYRKPGFIHTSSSQPPSPSVDTTTSFPLDEESNAIIRHDSEMATVPENLEEAPVQQDSKILDLADRILAGIGSVRGLRANQPISKVFVKREEIQARLLRMNHDLNPPEQIEPNKKVLVKLGLLPRDFDLSNYLRKASLLSTISLYDPQTKTLYVADSRADETQEEIKGSLVINLVNALQDQHFGFAPALVRVEGNDDATLARLAIVLGDALATLVDYSLRPTRRTFMELHNADPFFRSGIEKQWGEDVPEILEKISVFPFTYGFRFMQFYRKWNSWEDTARLYSDFPRSTEQILHPEKYAGLRDDPTEVEAKSPPQFLSAPWKRIYSNVLGEFALYLVLKRFVAERKAKWAAQGWDGDSLELFEHPEGGLALLFRSVWDAKKEAIQFAEAYASLVEEKYPGAQLVNQERTGQPKEKELRWEVGNDRIILRLNEAEVEIIEVDRPQSRSWQ